MSQLKGESFCALSPFQLSRSNIEIEAFNWLWFGAFWSYRLQQINPGMNGHEKLGLEIILAYYYFF